MEALCVLRDLRALDLAQTRVSTPGIIPLRHMTTLESLDLGHTYVGDEALFYLRVVHASASPHPRAVSPDARQ